MELTTAMGTLHQQGKTPTMGGAPVTERYDIIAEVARGGMGVVYRAIHKQLDKQVALKIVLPGSPTERFLREARVLAKIQSPYVVAIHDFDVLANGSPMLVMEWVEGKSLAQIFLQKQGPLPESTVVNWMRQVCEGMMTVAHQGVIHRDLKPSNILIDQYGKAKVVDFGLARGPGGLSSGTISLSVMGTPYYMAPEQAETPKNIDTRADIYSFGATFFHLLTGTVPFDAESVFSVLFKHKMEPLKSPRSLNPNLSEHISQLLERCLAKSPAERFSCFEDVLRYLEPAGAKQSPWEENSDAELRPYLDRYQQRRDVYLHRPAQLHPPDTYPFPNERMIKIVHGDIVYEDAEVLVSSEDTHLSMSGDVSAAIRLAAGREFMEQEVRKLGRVRQGRVVVTSAGQLRSRFIFHGITLDWENDEVFWPSRDLILEILQSCVYHADTLNVRSMAIPLLGTGVGRVAKDVCLDTIFQFLAKTLLRGVTSLRECRIVIFA